MYYKCIRYLQMRSKTCTMSSTLVTSSCYMIFIHVYCVQCLYATTIVSISLLLNCKPSFEVYVIIFKMHFILKHQRQSHCYCATLFLWFIIDPNLASKLQIDDPFMCFNDAWPQRETKRPGM